jgi:hypothetical protein
MEAAHTPTARVRALQLKESTEEHPMAAVVPLKARKGVEVAKPYEPTAREAESLASFEMRKAKRKPTPGMKVTMSDEDGQRSVNIEVNHPDLETGYRLMSESLGTDDRDFLVGTLKSLTMAAQNGADVDQDKLNYALAMVRGFNPKDQVEITLGVQMAAIHIATMRAAAFLGASKKREDVEAHEKSLNRLARTYVAQMEGLKRYRSKGEQRVYVERVTVHEGGQAIVGPISHGGRAGGGEETKD